MERHTAAAAQTGSASSPAEADERGGPDRGDDRTTHPRTLASRLAGAPRDSGSDGRSDGGWGSDLKLAVALARRGRSKPPRRRLLPRPRDTPFDIGNAETAAQAGPTRRARSSTQRASEPGVSCDAVPHFVESACRSMPGRAQREKRNREQDAARAETLGPHVPYLNGPRTKPRRRRSSRRFHDIGGAMNIPFDAGKRRANPALLRSRSWSVFAIAAALAGAGAGCKTTEDAKAPEGEPPAAPVAAETAPGAAAAAEATPASAPTPPAAPSIHAFNMKRLDGSDASLSSWAGKVVLIVNTASKCGYTPQYQGLQQLHAKYAERGFEVLGFPSNDFGGQEPGTAQEIQNFCVTMYDVNFPMFEKTKVIGAERSPLYALLSDAQGEPKWNFHKYLVDKHGRPVQAWGSKVEPGAPEIASSIEVQLALQ